MVIEQTNDSIPVRDKHVFTWNKIVGHKDCPAWRRWVVPLPFGFSLRYHDFTPGHIDTDPHSHPWWFFTLVINGSYTDIKFFDKNGHPAKIEDTIKTFRLRFRPRRHIHKVRISDKGCKTIVFTGRHHKLWGFYTPDGYMDAADYRKSHWAETICDR